MSISKPEVAELQAHAKFEQGFRYLDRCGEAMVRLLKILHTDWTAGEITPTGGVLRNFALGMSAKFNAESVTVEQDDVIDFETFTDQTCKIYEVLWRTFEIERIRIPLLRVTVKVGCPDQTIASKYVRQLGFATFNQIFLQGEITNSSYAIVTEGIADQIGVGARFRHRLGVQTLIQTKQPDYDPRLMLRVGILDPASQKAIRALNELRRKHVSKMEHVAQVQLEQTLEDGFKCAIFPFGDFLAERWEIAKGMIRVLPTTLRD